MGKLSDQMSGSIQELKTAEDVFEAVSAILYASLNPDFIAIAKEVDGELATVFHLSSGDDFRPSDFSRLSIPGLCYSQRDSCKIDDQSDVRSTAANPPTHDPALPDFRSLIVTPLGNTELVVLGAHEAEAFTEQDLQVAETISSFATAYLEDLRADADSSAKDEWVEQIATVLSHDVDNMLTTIWGNLELIQDDGESEELERIERSVDRLEKMIDDAVTALRSGGTEVAPESVDLSGLVLEAWDVVGNEDAQLILGDLGYAEADQSKLQQVFENILSNAVEHGDSNGIIWVGRFEDGLYIEDSGPGIPSLEQERIFESGYSSRTENAGFGLDIVQWIVEAHGWEISVEESEFGGARFEISGIPFEPEQ